MTDEIRALLARCLPGYEVRSLGRLGEGLDHVSYEVNGELIVRKSKETEPVHLAPTLGGFSIPGMVGSSG